MRKKIAAIHLGKNSILCLEDTLVQTNIFPRGMPNYIYFKPIDTIGSDVDKKYIHVDVISGNMYQVIIGDSAKHNDKLFLNSENSFNLIYLYRNLFGLKIEDEHPKVNFQYEYDMEGNIVVILKHDLNKEYKNHENDHVTLRCVITFVFKFILSKVSTDIEHIIVTIPVSYTHYQKNQYLLCIKSAMASLNMYNTSVSIEDETYAPSIISAKDDVNNYDNYSTLVVDVGATTTDLYLTRISCDKDIEKGQIKRFSSTTVKSINKGGNDYTNCIAGRCFENLTKENAKDNNSKDDTLDFESLDETKKSKIFEQIDKIKKTIDDISLEESIFETHYVASRRIAFRLSFSIKDVIECTKELNESISDIVLDNLNTHNANHVIIIGGGSLFLPLTRMISSKVSLHSESNKPVLVTISKVPEYLLQCCISVYKNGLDSKLKDEKHVIDNIKMFQKVPSNKTMIESSNNIISTNEESQNMETIETCNNTSIESMNNYYSTHITPVIYPIASKPSLHTQFTSVQKQHQHQPQSYQSESISQNHQYSTYQLHNQIRDQLKLLYKTSKMICKTTIVAMMKKENETVFVKLLENGEIIEKNVFKTLDLRWNCFDGGRSYEGCVSNIPIFEEIKENDSYVFIGNISSRVLIRVRKSLTLNFVLKYKIDELNHMRFELIKILDNNKSNIIGNYVVDISCIEEYECDKVLFRRENRNDTVFTKELLLLLANETRIKYENSNHEKSDVILLPPISTSTTTSTSTISSSFESIRVNISPLVCTYRWNNRKSDYTLWKGFVEQFIEKRNMCSVNMGFKRHKFQAPNLNEYKELFKKKVESKNEIIATNIQIIRMLIGTKLYHFMDKKIFCVIYDVLKGSAKSPFKFHLFYRGHVYKSSTSCVNAMQFDYYSTIGKRFNNENQNQFGRGNDSLLLKIGLNMKTVGNVCPKNMIDEVRLFQERELPESPITEPYEISICNEDSKEKLKPIDTRVIIQGLYDCLKPAQAKNFSIIPNLITIGHSKSEPTIDTCTKITKPNSQLENKDNLSNDNNNSIKIEVQNHCENQNDMNCDDLNIENTISHACTINYTDGGSSDNSLENTQWLKGKKTRTIQCDDTLEILEILSDNESCSSDLSELEYLFERHPKKFKPNTYQLKTEEIKTEQQD